MAGLPLNTPFQQPQNAFEAAMHIRKDDTVEVISGDDKGKRGRVLRIVPGADKLVVEGVNRVYRHMKPNRRNAQGGRLSKEMPISVANVLLIDPQTNKPTRTGVRILADGTKELYAKKSGTTLREITSAKKKKATPQA
jgi:large subunit ribosomal protein L24